MQVSAVNSTKFGGSYYTELSRNDIEKAEMLNQMLREYDDKFVSSGEDGQPKKKGFFGVAASLLAGGVAIFFMTKKGYNGASSVVNSLVSNKYAQKLGNVVKDVVAKPAIANSKPAKLLDSAKEFVVNSPKIQTAVEQISKFGVDNLVATAASVGATAYVATVDSDGNNVADIAEKGVSAYKGALKQLDFVKDVVDLLS